MLLFDKEEVVLLVERVFEEDVELCEASKSNIDWDIVFLGLVVVVLDGEVDGGSDDEATVGGCSEDFVSESDCCSDGSSDDDGIPSATVAVVSSLLVFQFGLTILGNNTPSSLLQPPW